MADIRVKDVITRVWWEGNTYVFDEAFWPQCGHEISGSGLDTGTDIASSVMGMFVQNVNLVLSEEGTAYIDVIA